MSERKELIYLPIRTTKDSFTIGACGRFREDKKHLTRTEASYLYVKLHEWILGEEETKIENIYLNRLKEQYIKAQELWNGRLILKNCYEYDAMRLFCLDTQLVSFNDIEMLEFEINESFS